MQKAVQGRGALRSGRWSLLAVALAVSGCGGSDEAGMASECFNPQLFAVGTTYQLDYQLSGGTPPGTRSLATSVQAASGASPEDRMVVTNTSHVFDVPVPGGSQTSRTRTVQSAEGLVVVTRQVFQSFSSTGLENEIPTVYQPPLRDLRYTLAPGGSFPMVHSVVQGSGVVSSTVTVTYVGQESVTVPAGTYVACKFEERSEGLGVRTTWTIKGKGIVARSSQPEVTMELKASSRLNGQPV